MYYLVTHNTKGLDAIYKNVFFEFTFCTSLKNSLIANGKNPEPTYILSTYVTTPTVNLSLSAWYKLLIYRTLQGKTDAKEYPAA